MCHARNIVSFFDPFGTPQRRSHSTIRIRRGSPHARRRGNTLRTNTSRSACMSANVDDTKHRTSIHPVRGVSPGDGSAGASGTALLASRAHSSSSVLSSSEASDHSQGSFSHMSAISLKRRVHDVNGWHCTLICAMQSREEGKEERGKQCYPRIGNPIFST